MGKPAAAAVPKTPKAAEPVAVRTAAGPPPETSDVASLEVAVVEESDAPKLLNTIQLRAFIETPTASGRLALLSSALHVAHYEANPRSLVWVDYCFGVLTFALDEVRLGETKTLALLHVANEVFGYATTPLLVDPAVTAAASTTNTAQPRAFPSAETVYDVFRQLVRVHSVASMVPPTDIPCDDSLWDASDVACVVAFMSSTFFRHMAAYQYVFQVPRQSLEREIALVVESPLPPLPLATSLPVSQE